MPHLVADYSANLAERCDIEMLQNTLYDAAVASGVFPLGGIRVRFHRAEIYAIADRHKDNAYLSVVLRIGSGRSLEAKKTAGALIFQTLETFFADELAGGHFMLSVDMVENDPDVSFKANGVHARL
ncbi:MAG: 5-carboxymethyl-2-hydroxymuconate isomerase [Pseudomonadota bacterium]